MYRVLVQSIIMRGAISHCYCQSFFSPCLCHHLLMFWQSAATDSWGIHTCEVLHRAHLQRAEMASSSEVQRFMWFMWQGLRIIISISLGLQKRTSYKMHQGSRCFSLFLECFPALFCYQQLKVKSVKMQPKWWNGRTANPIPNCGWTVEKVEYSNPHSSELLLGDLLKIQYKPTHSWWSHWLLWIDLDWFSHTPETSPSNVAKASIYD